MADDASYMSFLSKANANEPLSAVQETTSTSQARSKFDPTTTGSASGAPASISALLSSAQPHYVSETDSPFEPFFAPYSGESLPTAEEFAKSLGTTTGGEKGKVEAMETGQWDPRGQYKEVVEAVEKAGEGKVGVYRLEVTGTRAVYFVVTVAEKGTKLVGLKAESVES
jgi:hypothetical protein